jgi:hypothetical protein
MLNQQNRARGQPDMPKPKTIGCIAAFVAIVELAVTSANAFHSGHTGVSEANLRDACPAFRTGEIKLFDSVAPPGNLPMTDVFEHETGARCSCTRTRGDVRSLRCGPVAPATRRS